MFVEFLGNVDLTLPRRDWLWVSGVVVRVVDTFHVEIEYGQTSRHEIIGIRQIPNMRITTVRISSLPVFAMSARDNWLDKYNEVDADETWKVPNMNTELFGVLAQAGYVVADAGDGAWGFTERGQEELNVETRGILISRLFGESAPGVFGKAEALVLRASGFDANGYPLVGDNW